MADRFAELSAYCFLKVTMKNKVSDQMIKQLLNSVIAKYCDLLATDKSRYFSQPHPIIVNYCKKICCLSLPAPVHLLFRLVDNVMDGLIHVSRKFGISHQLDNSHK